MKNTTIIKLFNSDNSNIVYGKTQQSQIMTNTAYSILKFKFMIKKPIMKNHAFFAIVTFSRIDPFTYIILS